MSEEFYRFLYGGSIAVSHTTRYNPQVQWACPASKRYQLENHRAGSSGAGNEIWQWEMVLDALHSVRSLITMAANATPHERLFSDNRHATTGTALSDWLLDSNRVVLKNQNRRSKCNPLAEKVELLDCNPTYTRVRLPDGRENSVSLRNLTSITRNECMVNPDPSSMLRSHSTPSNSDQSTSNNNLTDVSKDPDVDTILHGKSAAVTTRPSAFSAQSQNLGNFILYETERDVAKSSSIGTCYSFLVCNLFHSASCPFDCWQLIMSLSTCELCLRYHSLQTDLWQSFPLSQSTSHYFVCQLAHNHRNFSMEFLQVETYAINHKPRAKVIHCHIYMCHFDKYPSSSCISAACLTD